MTMKLLLFPALMCLMVNAQTFDWVESVPLDIQTNPAYLHSPSSLDSYGNPVAAELINFKELYSAAYYGDFSIEKRNPSGSLIWMDTIYGKADVADLILDGENSVVCYGTFIDTVQIDTARLINPGPDLGSFILKLDSSGNLEWLIDGSAFISVNGAITAIERDGINNILLGLGDYPVEAKILRLNSEGDLISSINETNVATIGDIKKDISGNIWVTGFTFSGSVSFNGKDTTAPFTYNDYVVKYNPAGYPERINFIQDVTVQFFQLETDSSGNAYLAGNLLDSTSFGNIHANGPQWVYDFFVAKMDEDGNFTWLNEIPPGNSTGDAFTGNDNFLSCSADGQTYLTGSFRGEINYNDIFVLSYDPEGEIKWAKTAGGDLYNQGSSVTADRYGNCYLSGVASENFVFDTISGVGGNYNLYLAKLLIENPVTGNRGNPGSVYAAHNFTLDQNYPNPFNPSTTIRYYLPEESFVTIKLFDVLGNEVRTLLSSRQNAGSHRVKLDGKELSSGIYFYRIEAAPVLPGSSQTGNFIKTMKMILMK
jgi:hypothetical protein